VIDGPTHRSGWCSYHPLTNDAKRHAIEFLGLSAKVVNEMDDRPWKKNPAGHRMKHDADFQ